MSISEKQLIYFPHKPGCYLFKNKLNKIIYVGKAKDIKKRVLSYFKPIAGDFKVKNLVGEAKKIDFIITSNELEALLLEAKLIKENQPRYNIKLKSGVPYAYIRITKELIPRLETARFIKRDDHVFGPFVSAKTRKELICLANILFKLRSSKLKPRRIGNKYFVRISTSPWLREVAIEEYSKDIKKAELLLKGHNEELIGQLKAEMEEYSEKEEYELAKNRRNQIFALKNLKEKQKIYLKKTYDQDVINYIFDKDTAYIQLFNIRKGVISNRKDYVINFQFPTCLAACLPVGRARQVSNFQLDDFIRQFYFTNDIPQEIIIPEKLKEQVLIEKYLSTLAKRKAAITVPKAGNKKQLLDLLKENIISKHELGEKNLVSLRAILSLPNYPRVIECFDISNFGKENIVGSMVQFREGKPDKSNYRRFKIKTVRGQSDFDSIKEIVFRRYYRLKIEKSPFPDLVVIDGGKPQLTAALASLKELGLIISTIALAKQEEEIYTTDRMFPIKLARNNGALHILQHMRNEAHRFAIKYHRLLREKSLA